MSRKEEVDSAELTVAGKAQGESLAQTERRRKRSPAKYNARTHGIFIDVVLEDRESPAEFKQLVRLLSEDYGSGNPVVEILVGRLAMTLWQQRRLLRAEKKEIQEVPLQIETQRLAGLEKEAFNWMNSGEVLRRGLIARQENPFILLTILRWLRMLRGAIARRGFAPEEDRPALQFLYGPAGALVSGVSSCYESCLIRRNSSEASAEQTGVQEFLERLDVEIGLLDQQQGANCMEVERFAAIRVQSTLMVGPESLDRFIRYGSFLDRRVERNLAVLETLSKKGS